MHTTLELYSNSTKTKRILQHKKNKRFTKRKQIRSRSTVCLKSEICKKTNKERRTWAQAKLTMSTAYITRVMYAVLCPSNQIK